MDPDLIDELADRLDTVPELAGIRNEVIAETLATMVQHAGPEHVDAVMVDGRWLLRDGRILAFDDAAVLRDAADAATMLHERAAAGLSLLRTAMPGLAVHFRRG